MLQFQCVIQLGRRLAAMKHSVWFQLSHGNGIPLGTGGKLFRCWACFGSVFITNV